MTLTGKPFTSNVRRLQARIVKATQEGRWGKVKALQRLLTHSFSGKALAVRRVTENKGRDTPGVDKVIWNTPEKKATAIADAQATRISSSTASACVHSEDEMAKSAPWHSLRCECRAMQALYLLALDPVAETTADPNSYGFRQERSTADAMEQCFTALFRKHSRAMGTGRRHQRLFRREFLMNGS